MMVIRYAPPIDQHHSIYIRSILKYWSQLRAYIVLFWTYLRTSQLYKPAYQHAWCRYSGVTIISCFNEKYSNIIVSLHFFAKFIKLFLWISFKMNIILTYALYTEVADILTCITLNKPVYCVNAYFHIGYLVTFSLIMT